MTQKYPKVPFDVVSYDRRNRDGPCFICEIVAGNPEFHHHIVYETETAIVFLNKYPTLYGYVLDAPREHREQVTRDFTAEEYLELQRLIYKVADAIQAEVPTERLYLLSLGSQQGNRHVHWHLAPLPPGVPYDAQQGNALSTANGILQIPDDDLRTLAERLISSILASTAPQPR
jgi:ATP adenylyltransferase